MTKIYPLKYWMMDVAIKTGEIVNLRRFGRKIDAQRAMGETRPSSGQCKVIFNGHKFIGSVFPAPVDDDERHRVFSAVRERVDALGSNRTVNG